MAEQRAEGFWWVRVLPSGEGKEWCTSPKWRTAEVVVNISNAFVHVTREHQERRLDDPDIEWGPYLGKEPETIESLERKIADAFDAYVPKFAVPIPGAEQRMDEQLGKFLERQRSSLLAHGQQLHSESEPALVWDEERRAYREMTPDEVVLYSERCRYPLK